MADATRQSEYAHSAHRRHAYWVSAFICLLLFALLPATAAAEEETHFFNATLSLTGGCSASELSKLDPIPDPSCPDGHPAKSFEGHNAVAVDRYGNRYVANVGGNLNGSGGRIDVFNSDGEYVTSVEVLLPNGMSSLAVDSQGYLYVARSNTDTTQRLLRYKPTEYNSAAGEIEYGTPPSVVLNPTDAQGQWGDPYLAIAVDPKSDHLLVNQTGILELGSAAEGNDYVWSVGLEGTIEDHRWVNTLALDATRNRLYVSDLNEPNFILNEKGESVFNTHNKSVVKVFDLGEPIDPEKPRELLFKIDGSTTPTGRFVSEMRALPLAVDEVTGHVFVGDLDAPTPRVYEYSEDGDPVSTLAGIKKTGGTGLLQLAYDDSLTSPTQGYLFVPSHEGPGRSLAFEPKPLTAPPVVEALSASGITTSDAILHGKVNPGGVETSYRIEYTSEQEFQANGGFSGAIVVGEGTLKPASEGIPVSAPAGGLQPDTFYRFRILAESIEGQDEAEAGFHTFALPEISSDCPNQALRGGPSALLPDCRAYELVTPADTNGRPPFGPGRLGPTFVSRQVSPAGDKLPFRLEGAPLSGLEGTGSFNGDPYLATRAANGWSPTYEGPSAKFSAEIAPGSNSPDQGYSFWIATGSRGSGLLGNDTIYLRYPDGHSEVLGQGSLGIDPEALGTLISEGASHVIFATGARASSSKAVQLEPNAAPSGTTAIYDRTPDGITHVVSLKPGDLSFGAGQQALYKGASLDGEGVAFAVGNSLYLRHDNEETYEVAPQQALSAYKLSCDAGSTLAGATASYEWLLDGSPIPGATSSTYTPEPSQAGSLLQCRVRAANAEGGAIAIGQALLVDHAHEGGVVPRGGVNALPQAPTVGQTLQCETGTWSAEPSFAYQWYRNGDPIGGANAASYDVKAEDAQTQIQCAITATASGTNMLATSGPREVEPPAPPAGGTPSISNDSNPGQAPVVGNQLSCAKSSWGNSPTLSVQWLANGTAIAAATADTYTLTAEEEGDAVQCEVTATNADGTAKAVSKAVAVGPTQASEQPSGGVSVKGALAVGQKLECDKGAWQNSPTFAYQWLRNGTPIGPTTSTYTLTLADRETVVQCVLKASNAKGTVLAIAGGYVNEKPQPTASTPALDVDFAGVAEGGERLLYTQGGDLFAFDVQGEATTPFSESALLNGTAKGDVVPTTVSADGSTAYLVSPTVLSSEPNPEGDIAQPGEQNLYRSLEGQVSFVATVTERDVVGALRPASSEVIDGLGLWVESLPSELGKIPARATSDGGVLLFKSRAPLTDYNSGGKAEIYRYDSAAGDLRCISCDPTGAPASADATLQYDRPGSSREYFASTAWLQNLSADGRRAFFETSESLVSSDADGLIDVYEWEEEGVGGCAKPHGCLYLISSGQSGRDEHLWAVSESGDDVFFISSDLLAGGDNDDTPSIYDARVNGGFPLPPTPSGECLGEACQPAAVAPSDPTPASSSFQGSGNVREEAKAKKKAKKKHKSAKKHKKAKGKRRAGR